MPSTDDPAFLARQLAELRREHRELDAAIAAGATPPARSDADELQVKRLKKRKLLLRDRIARLESLLIPDLDA